MVEEEDLQVAAVSLPPAPLQVTLIDELTAFFLQSKVLLNGSLGQFEATLGLQTTYDFLPGTENKLLVQLKQAEPVFGLPALDIYSV